MAGRLPAFFIFCIANLPSNPASFSHMTLPNKLTASRFALTVLFLWAVFSSFTFHNTLALFFFCLAGITDFLDGRIARARNLITNFGILLDPSLLILFYWERRKMAKAVQSKKVAINSGGMPLAGGCSTP